MIAKEQIHPDIANLLQDRPMTGLSFFTFCIHHMIKFVVNEEGIYQVVVDKNLINGIPRAYSYLTEVFKTLSCFNEINEPFTIVYMAALNVDGPLEQLDAVAQADPCESVKTVVVE